MVSEEPRFTMRHDATYVAVKRIEQRNSRNEVGEDDVCREDGERSHQASDAVTEQLRTKKREDGYAIRWGDIVIQFFRCENGDSKGRVGRGRTHDEDGHMLLDVEVARVEDGPESTPICLGQKRRPCLAHNEGNDLQEELRHEHGLSACEPPCHQVSCTECV